jgi:hypothetical protein
MKFNQNLILVLSSILFFACDDSSSDAQTITGGSVNVSSYNEFQNTVTNQIIDLIAECCHYDEATKTKLASFYSQNLSSSLDPVAEGWATFDASQAQTCLGLLKENLTCEFDLTSAPKNGDFSSCENTLKGKQTEGMVCGKETMGSDGSMSTFSNDACVDGLVCGMSGSSEPTCVVPIAQGEACDMSDIPCADGLECSQSGVCDQPEAGQSTPLNEATCNQLKLFFGK